MVAVEVVESMKMLMLHSDSTVQDLFAILPLPAAPMALNEVLAEVQETEGQVEYCEEVEEVEGGVMAAGVVAAGVAAAWYLQLILMTDFAYSGAFDAVRGTSSEPFHSIAI